MDESDDYFPPVNRLFGLYNVSKFPINFHYPKPEVTSSNDLFSLTRRKSDSLCCNLRQGKATNGLM